MAKFGALKNETLFRVYTFCQSQSRDPIGIWRLDHLWRAPADHHFWGRTRRPTTPHIPQTVIYQRNPHRGTVGLVGMHHGSYY